MATAPNTKESGRFTTMFQAIARERRVAAEDFEQALNDMTVSGVIEALSNDERMKASPADRGVRVLQRGDATFQAYAYLSASGRLQIWMEALQQEPDTVLLAVARLSWNPVGQSLEQEDEHQHHARRVGEILRPGGRATK